MTDAPPLPPAADPASPPAWTAAELTASLAPRSLSADAIQAENQSLKAELNHLRRRDETLRFYMARLDDELRLAARLQQDFLPRSMPQVGPVRFHTLYRPAGYVSGDLYDVMRLDEQHVGLFVVDAVGHGMPAALLTMFIKRALVVKEIDPQRLAAGYRLLPPHETLARINDALCEQQFSQTSFATALYGIVNVRTLELSYCCAGHPAPVLMRDGTLGDLDSAGSLLGIFPGEQYTTLTTTLRPGDRLLAYSDGIEVAFGDEEAVANQRWRAELLARATLPAGEMMVDLSNRIDQEAGSLAPKDDLTIILAEVGG